MIEQLKYWFEKHGFDVSSRLSDRLGLRVSNVRLFFIYFSFLTLGMSFGVYFSIAFLLKMKDLIYKKRKSVFDL